MAPSGGRPRGPHTGARQDRSRHPNDPRSGSVRTGAQRSTPSTLGSVVGIATAMVSNGGGVDVLVGVGGAEASAGGPTVESGGDDARPAALDQEPVPSWPAPSA
jgi:hypothetical protein